MTDTFTKILLLSSVLFTGVLNWNVYSMNHPDNTDQSVNFQTVKLQIQERSTQIKSDYQNCAALIRDTNTEQLEEILTAIENNLEDVLSHREILDRDFKERQDDLLEPLIENSFLSIRRAQTKYRSDNEGCEKDSNSLYCQYYESALKVIYQNFIRNKYLMVQTALTMSKHNDLLEKIRSTPENELNVRFSDGFNAKAMLEHLFSYNHSEPSFQDNPLVNEAKRTYLLEEINDRLFESAISEVVQVLSVIDDHQVDMAQAELHYQSALSKKTRSLYRDLIKIIEHCVN